jgi:3-oxoadipate enol-lactonase
MDARGRPLPALHYTVREPRLSTAVPGAAFTPGAEPAPTVVLAHALGLDAMMWDALANQLAVDHRVICYDQRGHGASDCPPGPYGIEALAEDAARVIDHAGGSASAPVVFVGLSLGGMVGQQLALSRPELLRGLVLANTTAAYPASARTVWDERMAAVQAGGLEAVVDATLQRWFHEGFRAAHAAKVARWRRRVVSQNPEGYLACCAAIRELDLSEQLAHIHMPSLVIAGELDMATPPAMSEAIARKIAGAQFVLLKRASHLSVLEQPVAFSNLVREFIASV